MRVFVMFLKGYLYVIGAMIFINLVLIALGLSLGG